MNELRTLSTFFERLNSKNNGKLQIEESTWFNGRAYMPRFRYALEYNSISGEISLGYDFRMSESTRSTSLNSTAVDRHLVNAQLKFTQNVISEFSISDRSLLSRFLTKKEFTVSSRDKKLSRNLLGNKYLKDIYNHSANSPEFAPLISGKLINNEFYVSIKFNTMLMPMAEITMILKFLKAFSSSITLKE
ncbi:MAG: hypothetical protein ACI865_001170 [Flavobacteriaceae bacterium]|jgi:hypothetical protein